MITQKHHFLHQIIIALVFLFLCGTILMYLAACQEKEDPSNEDLPTEVESQDVVSCAKILQNDIENSDSMHDVFNGDYIFEINGSCTHTYFNDTRAHQTIHIPYKVSNKNGNELIDVAYFFDGVYVGSEIDYEYAIYKTWSDDRQSMFIFARLHYKHSGGGELCKSYSNDIVTKAISID